MPADVAAQPVPVGERLALRRQSGLAEERFQQAVGVILQQHFQVKVLRMLERTVEKPYLAQGEGIAVKPVLRLDACRHGGQDKQR